MPIPFIAAAAVAAAPQVAQMIKGWADARRGRKDMNSLLANRPQYEISKGYVDAFKTYQGLANQEMPGYQQMLGQLGQSSARATDAAERGAMGSNQYMSAVLASQDKEMEAIRNLGIMSSQWRTQQKQNLAGAQNAMGGLQDQQFDYNVNQPWQIRANMASERMGAGQQSGWQGLQGLAGTAQNYFGTRYYQDIMNQMYPKQGVSGQPTLGDVSGFQQFAPPTSAIIPTTGWQSYKGQIKP